MEPQGLARIRPALGIAFIVILVGYSLFVARNYLGGPDLIITFPENGYSTTSPAIHITGKAVRASFISINDRPIFIDEAGNWDEIVLLDPGYTIIKVAMRDRFDRSNEKILHVERTSERIQYQSDSSSTPTTAGTSTASSTDIN